jgi:hypothetical protein
MCQFYQVFNMKNHHPFCCLSLLFLLFRKTIIKVIFHLLMFSLFISAVFWFINIFILRTFLSLFMFKIFCNFMKFFIYWLKNYQNFILILNLNRLELKFIQYLELKMTELFDFMLTSYIISNRIIFCFKLALKQFYFKWKVCYYCSFKVDCYKFDNLWWKKKFSLIYFVFCYFQKHNLQALLLKVLSTFI